MKIMPVVSSSSSSRPYGRVRACLVAVCAITALFSGPLIAAQESDATKASIRAFVESLNEASMNFYSGGTEEDARERVRALIDAKFDVPVMAKYALARAWEKADAKQREELLAAMKEDIITAYLRRMRAPGTKLEFVGFRKPEGEDHLAASRRTVPGKADQIWIWWLRPDGDSWRITDLSVDGHSATATERQEYGTVFIDNHESVDAVLNFMRTRAARPIQAE